MNLKLVVASMSVLGLVSCPAFAATTTTMTKNTTHHRTVRHHQVKTRHVTHEMREEMDRDDHPDYKGMGSIVPSMEACRVSEAMMILDETNQNIGRAMPNPCSPDWFKRIYFSGGLNVDLGKWGRRSAGFMGENYQRLSLNDAYLNVSAMVNDWAKAFASISYNDATTIDPSFDIGEYSAAYSNNTAGGSSNPLQLEQAYITIGNFDVSPIYAQVGKQFQDFSRYELHPITRSMTQVMSETLATSAKVGFIVPMGFNGSVSVFDDPILQVGRGHKRTNYVASIGFDQPNEQFGYDIGAAWMYNLFGVNDIAYNTFTNAATYNSHVGGVAVYGDVNSGPFSLGVRWTGATRRFNPLDLPSDGLADVTAGVVIPTAVGAKPWAAGVEASYNFTWWDCRNNNVYVGYQRSHEAAGLNLPRQRWLAGYDVEAWKNTHFGIEWDHNNDYSVAHGGSGDTYNLVSLRAAVKFG